MAATGCSAAALAPCVGSARRLSHRQKQSDGRHQQQLQLPLRGESTGRGRGGVGAAATRRTVSAAVAGVTLEGFPRDYDQVGRSNRAKVFTKSKSPKEIRYRNGLDNTESMAVGWNPAAQMVRQAQQALQAALDDAVPLMEIQFPPVRGSPLVSHPNRTHPISYPNSHRPIRAYPISTLTSSTPMTLPHRRGWRPFRATVKATRRTTSRWRTSAGFAPSSSATKPRRPRECFSRTPRR